MMGDGRYYRRIIKISVFLAGLSGIVTEYIMSTVASYLIGDTIFQWSLIISLFLFAMGLGSRLTGYISSDEIWFFVVVELTLCVIIALSIPGVYGLVPFPLLVPFVLYGSTLITGFLIGMEIPLLIRINSQFEPLSANVSGILERDYFGALLGGLFFAFFGLPRLGPIYLAIVIALSNWLIALVFMVSFRGVFTRYSGLVLCSVGIFVISYAPFATALASWGDDNKYRDDVIYSIQTPYQRVVITKWRHFFWFYLDGHQQFSSYDEYRYHESLVHPAMLGAVARSEVLILGGGDGLAVREVLKYPDVKKVTLVDVDPVITEIAQSYPLLVDLNDGSLKDPRVGIVNKDAYTFLNASSSLWDVIIIDLPDPRTPSIERLYSVEFYKNCKKHLSKGGVIVTQATSPFFSTKAFWSIVKSIREAGFAGAIPLHAHVPTFGEWGWVIGTSIPGEVFKSRVYANWDFFRIKCKFLDLEVLKTLFVFSPADEISLEEVEANFQFKPVIFKYYREGLWEMN